MKKNGFLKIHDLLNMSKLKPWLSAFRLRTLPLSLSGIIIGSCLAYFKGVFDSLIFILAILTTVSFQILSNLANDYGDGVKGTDGENRIGPKRAIQSGVISHKEMFNGIKINIVICVLLSFLLIFYAFGLEHLLYTVIFFVLAGLSIYAAIKYTMGDSAYGYKGLGDVFVFIFFGLVSVLGSYFLYVKQFDFFAVLPAVALGMLSMGVLNLNNMRDRESDIEAKKITLAVRLGESKSKLYHFVLILGAMIIGIVFSVLYYTSFYNLLFLLSYIPLVKHLIVVYKTKNPKDFDPQLKILSLSTFLFAVLLGVGYLL